MDLSVARFSSNGIEVTTYSSDSFNKQLQTNFSLSYYGFLPLCGMASLAMPFPLLPVAGKDSAKINAGNAIRMLKG